MEPQSVWLCITMPLAKAGRTRELGWKMAMTRCWEEDPKAEIWGGKDWTKGTGQGARGKTRGPKCRLKSVVWGQTGCG